MEIKKIVILIFISLSLASLMAMTSVIAAFWDLPSFFLSVGIPFFVLSLRIKGNLKLLFRSRDLYVKAKRSSLELSMACSTFGVFAALVVVFGQISDWSNIGPAIAVTIIPWLYTSILWVVLSALEPD